MTRLSEPPSRGNDWTEWREELSTLLVGRRIVRAEGSTLTLDNGQELVIDQHAYDCCSGANLVSVAACDNVITAVTTEVVTEVDDDPYAESCPFKASIVVITESGVAVVAESEGDYSNGYYLDGFALGIEVR